MENSEKSWDVDFRNDYNAIKHNASFVDETLRIPERAKIVRKGQPIPCAISFAKRGNNALFAIANPYSTKAEIVPPEKVLNLFRAGSQEQSFEYDECLDRKFTVLRDEIRRTYVKIRMDKRKSQAIDNLEKLAAVYASEKDYIADLLDVIKSYDDLSDGELKYLANLSVSAGRSKEIVEELKLKIPVNYIIQIKRKVESIDAQSEIIMFTEDLRSDND